MPDIKARRWPSRIPPELQHAWEMLDEMRTPPSYQDRYNALLDVLVKKGDADFDEWPGVHGRVDQ
mgnify:CR=1 FL=1